MPPRQRPRSKESEAEFARTSYDRWRDSPAGVVSVQEREAKKAAFDSSVAQLNAARARVNVDHAKVERPDVPRRL